MYPVSSTFLTKIKESSRTIDASVGIGDIAFTNMVSNGDMSSGTTGWLGSSATVSNTDGTLTMLATAQNGYAYQLITTVIGKKYYIRGKVKATSNLVKFGFGGTSRVAHSGSGDWEYISQYITATSTSHNAILIDGRASAWTNCYMDDVVFLDLTAIYGAGNEPTQAYFDDLFLKYGSFAGTKNYPVTILGTDTIVSFDKEHIFGSNNMPTIGSVTSAKLNLKLIKNEQVPQVLVGVSIRPTVAVMISTGVYEWVTLGTFIATSDDVEIDDNTITMDCFDKMTKFDEFKYSSNLTYPANLGQVADEMETAYADWGLNFQERFGGRNICHTDFALDWESGHYDSVTGAKTAYPSRVRTKVLIPVLPNTTYYVDVNDSNSTFNFQFVLRTYNGSSAFVRSIGDIGNGATFTTGATEYYIGVIIYEGTDTVTFSQIQTAFANGEIKPMITLNSEPNKTYEDYFRHLQMENAFAGTLRQVIGQMASLCTQNAIINDSSLIEFKYLSPTSFTIDSSNYIDFKLVSDSNVKISQLTSATGVQDEVYTVGDDTGFAISFTNTVINSTSELQSIFNREFPLYFYAYTMRCQGFPHLEVGDLITFTDKNNFVRTLAIINHKLSFNGGLISEFKVDAPSQTVTDTTPSGLSSVGQSIAIASANLQQSIIDATNLITGNQGGYVVTILDEISGLPREICIIDEPDINTAQKVWRWNASGLGYSSNGYTGDYELAITSAGQINASFILTGLMNADLIKTGTLQSIDGSSWINMENGTFSLGNGKLSFQNGTFTINYNGTDLATAIDAKADQIEVDTFYQYFTFDPVSGLTISKQGSPFQITIDNDSIDFKDSGTVVAWINGQKMYIKDLETTNSIIVGKHKIEKYASGNLTLIKYVG